MVDLQALLATVALLDDLTADESRQFVALGQLVHAPAGHVLYEEFAAADGLYLVLEGEIAIRRRKPNGQDLPLATLGAGDVFGELALIDAFARQTTAQTLTPAQLFLVPATAFAHVRRQRQPFAFKILRALSPAATSCYRQTSARFIESLQNETLIAGDNRINMPLPPLTSAMGVVEGPSVLADLDPSLRRRLMEDSIVRDLQPGEILCREGEISDDLFLVDHGRIRIKRLLPNGRLIEVAGAGSEFLLGELSWLDGEPRGATLTAESPVRVFLYGREVFEQQFERQDPLAFALLDIALAQCSRRLLDLEHYLCLLQPPA